MAEKELPIISFGKLGEGMPMPHLLDIQTEAFQTLLTPEGEGHQPDVGLDRVFRDLFPISDVNENYILEFVSYGIGDAKYTVEECIERDMTYSAPLKATLRLVILEESHPGDQAAQEHPREGSLSRGAAPADAAGHLRHQRRRARDRVAAAPLAGRGLRGDHPSQRPAPVQRAHHPVPRLVGRVHHRHPRRGVRAHRQEEEVPGDRAAAGVRLLHQLADPRALLRQEGARYHRESPGAPAAPRDPRARCSRPTSPTPRTRRARRWRARATS